MESRFDWAESDGASIRVFSEGDELFDAMLDDIARARERIRLESYIFADDEVGERFLTELSARAERGVDVRVRVDAIGSRLGFSGASAKRLRAAGVRFQWCHAWQWRRPLTLQRRNHRKLLVVDGVSAYLGGFNVSDVGSWRAYGPARWRDTHLRVTGSAAAEAEAAYEAFGRGELDWSGDEDRALYLISNSSSRCRFRLRCLLRDRFDGATERIWLTTPYFVPDLATQQRLCRAAERGVDVRVIVPGKSDVPIVQWAGRAAYARLLCSGVRVHEYQPRTLHAKTLLVDRDWSTIGTANFDYRSFVINYELNAVGRSRRLNSALAVLFQRDLASAREISVAAWSRRPVPARIAEAVGWAARRWL